MMCGRDEEPQQVQQPIEQSLRLMHAIGIWICAISNKQQALRGLKKTVDDTLVVCAQVVKNESKRK